jgi:hypothetical protein
VSGPFDRPTEEEVRRWLEATRDGTIPRRQASLNLGDLDLPERPRIRWWWSRRRKELARTAYARRWQRALWEQAGGAPVHLGTIRQEDR